MITPQTKTYLCVDPGLKNCGVGLVRVLRNSGKYKAILLWSEVFNLSGNVNPDKDRSVLAARAAEERLISMGDGAREVIVEFQPPLATRANPALVRWNSWVEGFWVSYFQSRDYLVKYVHSNPMKIKLGLRSTGNHYMNKRLALELAADFLGTPAASDHEADCVLMGVYSLMKENP